MDRWNHAKENEGQVFVLSGEAGIGKSQISTSLINNLAGSTASHSSVPSAHPIMPAPPCSPLSVISSVKPASCAAMTTIKSWTSWKTLLSGLFEDITPVAALFAALLSLPLDRYPPIELEPLKQREETLKAFVEFVRHQAQQSPLLMPV